jgi:hypothetical protein
MKVLLKQRARGVAGSAGRVNGKVQGRVKGSQRDRRLGRRMAVVKNDLIRPTDLALHRQKQASSVAG